MHHPLFAFTTVLLLFSLCNAQQDPTPVLPIGAVISTTAERGTFSYFTFYNTRRFQFNVRLINQDRSADVDLYMLQESKPLLNSYEARAASGVGGEMIIMNTKTNPAISEATNYFVGAYCVGPNNCTFDLRLDVYDCPGNCSSKGTCNLSQLKCECEVSFTKEDCSMPYQPLRIAQPMQLQIADEFYFSVNLTSGILNYYDKLHIDMIATSLIDPNPYYIVYLKYGRIPSRTDYDLKRSDVLRTNFTFEVCFSELQNGTLYGLIINQQFNPLNLDMLPYFLAYCPSDDCNGHGTCNVFTGKCTCNAGWLGSDCNIPDETSWKFITIAFFFGGMTTGIVLTLVTGAIVAAIVTLRNKRVQQKAANDYLRYTDSIQN